jgi:hypothetical protein
MLTPYQTRKDEEFDFDWEIFSVENTIEKESEEGRMLIQNKCVSSQKIRMKKEEGATVGVLSSAILPYLSQRAASLFLRRAVGSVLQRIPKTVGKGHKLLKMSQLRNAGVFRHLIDSPKQMKQIQRCRWIWQKHVRLKTQECKWHKTTVHSLFFRL